MVDLQEDCPGSDSKPQFDSERPSHYDQGTEKRELSFQMITPKKCKSPTESDLPLTPTANLKMLVCAASVASPARDGDDMTPSYPPFDHEYVSPADTYSPDSQDIKEECAAMDDDDDELLQGPTHRKFVSRKQKSLGLLCTRFLEKYPEDIFGTELCIDDVTKELGVERRRVYDIVNVLESMEMMTKMAKNRYTWRGPSQLDATLSKLKAIAMKTCRLNSKGETIFYKDSKHATPTAMEYSGCKCKGPVPIASADTLTKDDLLLDFSVVEPSDRRQGRSLGILCQKFLMLFIMKKDHTVSLECAANTLIQPGESDYAKHKTKVRRLYDIANILSSMSFVEKVIIYDQSVRTTAFKWTGVDLDDLQPDKEIFSKLPSLIGKSSKQSILTYDCQVNRQRRLHERSSSARSLQRHRKKLFSRSLSAACLKDTADDVVAVDAPSPPAPASNAAMPHDIDGSPTEKLFRKELHKLQEKFPEKLSQSGLLDMVTSGKTTTVTSSSSTSVVNTCPAEKSKRRCLHDAFESQQPTSPKQIKVTVCGNTVVRLPAGNVASRLAVGTVASGRPPLVLASYAQAFPNQGQPLSPCYTISSPVTLCRSAMSVDVADPRFSDPRCPQDNREMKQRSRSWPLASVPVLGNSSTAINTCFSPVAAVPMLLSYTAPHKSADYIHVINLKNTPVYHEQNVMKQAELPKKTVTIRKSNSNNNNTGFVAFSVDSQINHEQNVELSKKTVTILKSNTNRGRVPVSVASQTDHSAVSQDDLDTALQPITIPPLKEDESNDGFAACQNK